MSKVTPRPPHSFCCHDSGPASMLGMIFPDDLSKVHVDAPFQASPLTQTNARAISLHSISIFMAFESFDLEAILLKFYALDT